ncbi:MAG TPA: fluoride efflux transporter CrcB [Thermomicrobiaceae bacterium]|nr:fluoride efflux transporter CrcB [Thermomicrobiaceae bacterium]
MEFLLVGIGGALGAISRLVVSTWVAQKLGATFPYGTLAVNVTGSLLLGFIMTLATERASFPAEIRPLIAVGFIGAYTTFSTFSYETMQLLLAGSILEGTLNIVVSLAAGLAAILAGIVVARAI